MEDGVTGFLVETVDECAQRSLELLEDPALGKALGRRGKEHVRATSSRLATCATICASSRSWRRRMMTWGDDMSLPAQRSPLVLVSNRGPVTFGADGEVQRGTAGWSPRSRGWPPTATRCGSPRR